MPDPIPDPISSNPHPDATIKTGNSEEQYRTLFESIDSAFCIIEVLFDEQNNPLDYLFVACNPAFERHTGLVDAVGKTIRELVPGIDESWFPIYGNVVRTGVPVRFENHDPALRRWFDAYALRFGPAENHRVGILFTDITARKEAQEALQQSEEQRQDAQARLETALSAGNIATWTLDLVSNRLVTDDYFSQLFGVPADLAPGADLSRFLPAIHPDDIPRVLMALDDAAVGRREYHIEYRLVRTDGSIRYVIARGKTKRDENGRAISLTGVIVDITERVERERRERFLADLAERTRFLSDPGAVIADAVRTTGEFLQVDRCVFVDINLDTDALTILPDYRANDSVVSVEGVHPMSAFGAYAAAEFKAGRAVVVDDVQNDPLRVPPESIAAYESIGIGAHISVPSVYSSRTISVIGVHSRTARHWLPEEVELLRTVVERTWLAVENARLSVELREEAEQRREQGEYLRRLVESSPDCIKTLDLAGNILSMNEGGQQIMEIDDFSEVCGLDWRTFWEGDAREAVISAIDTARAGGTGHFQGYCPTHKGTPRWWDVIVAPILGADGKPEQLMAISRDVTDQKRVEERERARLTDIFMRAPAFMAALRGPDHLIEMANLPYHQLVGNRDILGKTVAEALPEVVEQGFIGLLDRVYQTGEAFVGNDIPVVLQPTSDSAPEEHFLDFTYQPLFDEEGTASGILVHGIDLTERKHLEQERERLLAETRARAEREALLNQIGTAVRGALEPENILRVAVAALGQGLGADRCYFVRYDQARDTARVFPEWHREEAKLQSLEGRTFQMSSYSVDRDPTYKTGSTHVVEDVVAFDPNDAAPLLELNIHALMRVPIDIGAQMTALAVAMAHGPRAWTPDEVRLVENVATLLHSTLETAHTQQRERNIAQQLQAALQPPSPPDLPGLALKGFYKPALTEAGVGGDFFDVFDIEKGCTALVVADLSGKGLAAASQVATVRNMARFALYNGVTIASAVTTLHHTLVEHDLLEGFATLFLGVYDHNQRTMTYVNCGQEPGLIWRATTGVVEQLPPTGPVLGGFESGAGYAEKVVRLSSGDVLAIFTDGLTEVGPNRRELLELSGVSDLFHECCAAPRSEVTPQFVLEHLIAGVDAYGQGGVRDDIALLVGVVGGR